MAIVVSVPGGRWSQELQGKWGRQALADAAVDPALLEEEGPEQGPGELVVGLAAVTWRCVLGVPSNGQSYALMSLVTRMRRAERREQVRFVEHPFLDAACVVGTV